MISFHNFHVLLVTGAFLLSSCQSFRETSLSGRMPAQEGSEKVYLEKGLFPEEKIINNRLDDAGAVKVVFNLPPYINPGNAGIVPEMIATIDNAKKSIRMSIFQFNHDAIFSALEKAVQRGVRVYLTTDLCYSGKTGYKEYFERLRAALNMAGQNAATQIIDDGTVSCDTMFNHNKYMIVDIEVADLAKAWFGSFNPTNHGAVENVELAIVVNDKKTADVLMLDFDQQVKGQFKVAKKGVYQITRNGKSENVALSEEELKSAIQNKIYVSYPKVSVGGVEFEFILSPKVKSLTRIVEEIYKSKKEILFSSFAIADQMLISSLINKSNTGESEYNLYSILALPHPGDSEGIVFLQNGDPLKQQVLFEKTAAQKKADAKTLAKLNTIAAEINQTVATPINYLTPKNEIKSVYRYFYPHGAEGGKVNKVKVEGIFNNKVINEKTTLKRLENAGISIYKSTLTGELHNKLFLIDEETTIFGSHNFSQSAENINDELTVIVKSGRLTSLLKNELFNKTKMLSHKKGSAENFSGKASLIISEIMAESTHKINGAKRVIDAGDYVEIFNYGHQNINLLAFRLDDHYFPATNNEVLSVSSNAGLMGTLVRFKPAKKAGELGALDYRVTQNILPPGRVAMIVGKYFHPDYFLENFKVAFKKQYGKDPGIQDEPLLFSFGEHFSSVLGDAATGLSAKDKLSLYGIDGMTAIDRFSYPRPVIRSGTSLQRTFDVNELRAQWQRRRYQYEEKKYTLKNGQIFMDTSFIAEEGYSSAEDWQQVDKGSPGIVAINERGIASTGETYAIEGLIADVHNNKWMEGVMIIKDGKILDLVKSSQNAIRPLFKDVLMFPGLIDTHNHIKYNSMPVWIAGKTYQNRDQWPEEAVYRNGVKELYKNVYGEWAQCNQTTELEKDKCLAINRCKILLYAEMKALMGGTTSIQGSSSFDETSSDITFRGLTPYLVGDAKKYQKSKARIQEDMLDACSSGGARNLEREKWRGYDEIRTTATSIYSDAWSKKKVADKAFFSATPSGKLTREFETQATRTFFVHLGEGIDAVSKNEWKELSDLKLNTKETTIIHATAFSAEEFSKMGQNGQSIAWSPTSNLLLYKKTTDVLSALKNKVNVSIGSDWSLSGTKSMLYELKVAHKVNQKVYGGQIPQEELLRMVTINGAKAAHLETQLGSLERGKLADFFMMQKSHLLKTPFETLLKAQESNISAVFVGGLPVVARPEIMKEIDAELALDSTETVMDASCAYEATFHLPGQKINQMINELNHKTKTGFSLLKPAYQKSLGHEFSMIDPLCSERDTRMINILNSL